jgi:hypothetical protein
MRGSCAFCGESRDVEGNLASDDISRYCDSECMALSEIARIESDIGSAPPTGLHIYPGLLESARNFTEEQSKYFYYDWPLSRTMQLMWVNPRRPEIKKWWHISDDGLTMYVQEPIPRDLASRPIKRKNILRKMNKEIESHFRDPREGEVLTVVTASDDRRYSVLEGGGIEGDAANVFAAMRAMLHAMLKFLQSKRNDDYAHLYISGGRIFDERTQPTDLIYYAEPPLRKITVQRETRIDEWTVRGEEVIEEVRYLESELQFLPPGVPVNHKSISYYNLLRALGDVIIETEAESGNFRTDLSDRYVELKVSQIAADYEYPYPAENGMVFALNLRSSMDVLRPELTLKMRYLRQLSRAISLKTSENVFHFLQHFDVLLRLAMASYSITFWRYEYLTADTLARTLRLVHPCGRFNVDPDTAPPQNAQPPSAEVTAARATFNNMSHEKKCAAAYSTVFQ